MALQRFVGPMVVAGALLLAGCASKVPDANEYSGFLGNYSNLQPSTSASGAPILRWVSPSFNPKNYSALVYEPVVYYPEAHPSSQVGQRVLDGVLSYTNNKLKTAAEQRMRLVSKPGPGVLIFRGAITAVNTSDQDLKPRELIPFALVVAGARAATGMRPKDTNLFFEGELLDGVTRQSLVKIVRKGTGIQVTNAEQQVTADDLRTVIDQLGADAVMFDARAQPKPK